MAFNESPRLRLNQHGTTLEGKSIDSDRKKRAKKEIF
jgi:hypothetical protein